ncbi:MAG TPA: nucleotidyltransferase [Planctomycetes bacterium]|nr:nucleotidyltransferase [Planctomycetota bacterium]
MRSDTERLLDVLDAIDKIDSEAGRDKKTFEGDPLRQIWVVYHLQIIGEAVSRISSELRRAYPDIPWGKIAGMRHVLVHGYFDVDLDIVWAVVENDLPDLKQKVAAIVSK